MWSSCIYCLINGSNCCNAGKHESAAFIVMLMVNKIKIYKTEILSANWYVLKKITYEYLQADGPGKRKPGRRMTGETVLLFYCIARSRKQ